jgi:hypothetical protein
LPFENNCVLLNQVLESCQLRRARLLPHHRSTHCGAIACLSAQLQLLQHSRPSQTFQFGGRGSTPVRPR